MLPRLALPLLAVWLALPGAGLAADDTKPLSRIVLGSCLRQDREQAIWGPLLDTKPELFLFLGDNIYADTDDPDELRKTYAQLGAQPGYKKLQAACPILATWDDHDYAKEDQGGEFAKKKESQQAFLDFFGIPKDSPRRSREGIYHAAVFGPAGKRVQVILLDMRYHRSLLKKDLKRPRNLGQYVANDDPDATMLGAEQWKWLEEQLRMPAEVRLLCSSVQVVAEDHGFERWMNMPRERARLYEMIRNTRAGGVVVLSGDRHLAELSVMDADISYPLYDLTSSGLNQANKRFRALEVNRHRVATMDRGNNFGMVRIDWQKEDPIVSLEIHDEDGDVTIRHKIPLSRLQPVARRKVAKTTGGNTDLAAEARNHKGKEWTVELFVLSTGASRDKKRVFLNSEKDFKSERNLTIVLEMAELKGELKTKKIDDPRKHFVGKKIRVKGTVTEFRDSPQLEIRKLEQIEVIE